MLVIMLVAVAARPARGQEVHEHGPETAVAGILPPGNWTPEQVAFATDLVARTETALAAYRDRSKLEGLGFYNFGIVAPGGWDHWINKAWWDDGRVLDPAYPESLVYRQVNGAWQLEAAMFYLPPGHDLSTVPPEYAWLPGWHTHDGELCVDGNDRFTGIASGGTCSTGTPMVSPPMMHVWIVDNPCGHRFAGIGIGGIECGAHHQQPPVPVPPEGGPWLSTPPQIGPSPGAPRPVRATPVYTG
jgi:hypothetical protein